MTSAAYLNKTSNTSPHATTLSAAFQQYAKRAGAIASLATAAALTSGCVSTQMNTDTCMGGSSVNLLVVGTTKTAFNEDCAEAEYIRAALNSENKTLNAHGALLQMDARPQVRKYLEARLGRTENVRMEPEAVADLLANPGNSRYLGGQFYARLPQEDRTKVDGLLNERGIDPKAALSLAEQERWEAADALKQTQIKKEQEERPTQKCQTVITSGNRARLVCDGPQ